MKLPAVFQRNTAASLQNEREDLAATEATVLELEQEQAAKSDAPIDEREAIYRQIERRKVRAELHRQRIAKLESEVAVEEQARDEERFRQAVAAVERALPARLKAAAEFEESLAAVTSAAKKFQKATRAVFASWPTDIEIPGGAFLNPEKSIAYALCRFVGGLDLVSIDPVTRRKHSPDFLSAVLQGNIFSVAGPVEAEHSEFVHYLHHFHDKPDPEPVEDEAELEPQADESEVQVA